MWIAVTVLAFAALLAGGALGYGARRLSRDSDDVVERIDALLPQTQCAQCGYPGCRPYAEAIARGEAGINLCPPGGTHTVQALSRLLEVEPEPLAQVAPQHAVAFIDESRCIGCTLCIQACPVDAIVGAHQQMHTVIEAECTGCELCIAPCPVDCITLERPTRPLPWRHPQPGSSPP